MWRLDNGCDPLLPVAWYYRHRQFVSLWSAGELSQFPVPPHGTTFRPMSHLYRHSRFSETVWKHFYSPALIPGHPHLIYAFSFTTRGPNKISIKDYLMTIVAFKSFSSVSWAIHISWSSVCLCVFLDVNQGGTNRNRCTQTYYEPWSHNKNRPPWPTLLAGF